MKIVKRVMVLLSFVFMIFVITSCNNQGVKFESWNEGKILTGFKDYVGNVTNKNSKDYIPVEDRIAVFDMDGTLYGELFPEYLEYLMLEYRILDDPTFKDKATDELKDVANQIRESGKTFSTPNVEGFDMIHANAAAKAYAGMTVTEFNEYTNNFLKKDVKCFKNMTYKEAFYKPMIEVVKYLQQNEFTTYVVSGSDRLLCRALVCDVLNIPESQVIGMDVKLEGTDPNGADGLKYQFKNTDSLVRTDEVVIKNLKMNKVALIAKEIGKQPVISFGNSSGDTSMHVYTTSNNKYKSQAYMLVADDTERDHAKIEEANKRRDSWEEYGFNIISMKNDFRTIYGDKVEIIN